MQGKKNCREKCVHCLLRRFKRVVCVHKHFEKPHTNLSEKADTHKRKTNISESPCCSEQIGGYEMRNNITHGQTLLISSEIEFTCSGFNLPAQEERIFKHWVDNQDGTILQACRHLHTIETQPSSFVC